MQMKPVKSSSVKSVGYDASTKALRVEFASGHSYDYADVPQSLVEKLHGSDSIGKFLAAHIKPKFKANKVTHAHSRT